MARPWIGRFVASSCVVALLLACFEPAISDARQLAYRDYSDFYYPLYQRVQQEWEAGRLPLWAEGENGGSPMLGNPTSAVLYPGKLIYAAFSYPRAAKVYVVAHILLAFASMVTLLRRGGVSEVGSALGGLAYGFGAPVLTQYANIVFLVGAAWMPLGFRFADGWVRLGRPRSLAGLALVLAMQVLGGDPEAAYLTAFAAGAYAVGRSIVGEPEGRTLRLALTALGLVVAYLGLLGLEVADLAASRAVSGDEARAWWPPRPSTVSLLGWVAFGLVVAVRCRGRRGLEGTLLGLLGASALGAALAGAQLVPTVEFVAQSTRGGSSPHFDIYAHSIHPARVVEWAFPGAFGSSTHRDRVWLTALPPTEDFRVWMSSVAIGGLTLLLAVASLGLRGGSPLRGWLSGVALVSVLAGFGPFAGPLFWARAVAGTETRLGTLERPEPELPRADGRLRDGDGGPYWFLATSLPGFRSFRYPGKLFIPAALGMAAMAGMGFDGLVAGRRRVASGVAWVLLATALVGLIFAVARPSAVLEALGTRAEAVRSSFGPFDVSGAASGLRVALGHGSVVLVAFLVLARLAPRRPLMAGMLALTVMTLDLALSNRGEVSVVEQSAYEASPAVLEAIRRSERDDPEPGPFRVFRVHGWTPPAWSRVASPDRLERLVRWERDTLRPKYEQPLGVPSTFAYGTTELADYGPFFEPFPLSLDPETSRKVGAPAGRKLNYFPRRGYDLWNTRYFILPTRMAWGSPARGFASLLPESEPIYPPAFPGPDAKGQLERWGLEQDVQVLRNRAAYPRAWVVRRAIPIGERGKWTQAERRRVMIALLYQDDELWHVEGRPVADPRRVAWVEAPLGPFPSLQDGRGEPEPVEVIAGDDPTRVELAVQLRTPGLVVLADISYPGWRLELDGRPAEILKVNLAMRGAIVPEGSHRLVYTYRPESLKYGVGLSIVGGIAWVTLLAFGRSSDRVDPKGSDRLPS